MDGLLLAYLRDHPDELLCGSCLHQRAHKVQSIDALSTPIAVGAYRETRGICPSCGNLQTLYKYGAAPRVG